jgi:DNA-directed RNA polymerase specialized sigma24 family protein
MSRSRRFFEQHDARSQHGPSDEMLAVDAATEIRSLTLLYERFADRLFRYFLLCTADPATAERMVRDLLSRLPGELNKFAGQDRSFGGWLFARASDVFWREFSVPSRMYRRVSRFIPQRSGAESSGSDQSAATNQLLSEFDEIAPALRALPPDQREVLGIHFGASLRTAAAAEALRLPASLISSHVQWSLQSLAEHLDVSSTNRLSEDLTDLVRRQSLTGQQRQSHFGLIHGMFFGEVELESDEKERTPIFEIGALVGVVILGLVGIWIWGLITEGDTRQHEVASSPPEETASDFDPVSTVTPEPDPEPTPQPSPETATEDDTAAGAGDVPGTCGPEEGRGHFDRFISYFNDLNLDALHDSFPADGANGSSPDSRQSGYLLFVHGDVMLEDRYEIMLFLRERYDVGERWEVLDAVSAEHDRITQSSVALEMYQDWKRENPGQSMIIVRGLDRSGDGAQPEILQGRVIVDCESGQIISWELRDVQGSGSQSVNAGDFVGMMGDLGPGESRTVSARVVAISRVDGGALNAWELTWAESGLEGGATAERVDVTALDGTPIIGYVNDGDRWRIDQRGWIIHGSAENEPPFPDEVGLVLPWIREAARVLQEFDGDLSSASSITINEDFSDETVGGTERRLELSINSGDLSAIRVLESTPNGERARPEIYLISAPGITDQGDPGRFSIESDPQFPELDTVAPRFEVPESESDQLDLVSMTIDNDQTSEQYLIRWNQIEMDLIVEPSRGGVNPESVPESIDESWTTAVTSYRWGQLIWAHRQFSGYPTDALWDDGRYRFVLSVDREAIDSDHEWDLQELVALANVLSLDPDDPDDEQVNPSPIGGSGLSRGSTLTTGWLH